MQFKWITPVLAALSSSGVFAADAPITKDNTGTAVYSAELLNKENTTIRGVISGQAGPHGRGVRIHLRFTGLPNDDSLAPYMYHIHEYPVPENGDCYATGGHLNPYGVPDDFKCDPQYAQRCQVGDLSGKHGKLPKGEYLTMYKDDYLSINTMDEAFFGSRSIVVHSNNNTRLNCGNFQKVGGGEVAVPVVRPNLTTNAPPGFPSTATMRPWYTGIKPAATGESKSTKHSSETSSSRPKTYHSPTPSSHEETTKYTNGGAQNTYPSVLLSGLFVLLTSFFIAK